ncbi:MAG: amidohydrolase [Treponema sp.]|jgi:amidohydrolase|nr:amidohydrolase [Treponema sp.]
MPFNTSDLQQTLEHHFKWFHRHPELSNQETGTTARIREILSTTGVTVLDTGLRTGLVARIGPEGNGKVIALRCDIDALPLSEASGLDYASEHASCMHACGHDFHLSAMLGAALLLKEQEQDLAGTVKLIFQPAEEGGGGAQQVLDSGVLDDVQEIYGIHVASELEAGIIAVSPGATYASVGSFRLVIQGKGGHAAAPHECRDPIVAAAQVINAVQSIVSRETSPFDQVVVSVTHIEAGTTWNVIPQEALLEGTFRAFSAEKLGTVATRIEQISRSIAEMYNMDAEYQWHCYTISTNNDPELCEFVVDTAKTLGLRVVPSTPQMSGEDFALYQQRIRGVFWNIGVGSLQGTHHPGFVADPAPLSTAAQLLAALGGAALERG